MFVAKARHISILSKQHTHASNLFASGVIDYV